MTNSLASFEKTKLNTVKRMPERGRYDKETLYPIIDAALLCHVGFVQDGQPFVIPTIHARRDDSLLLHGAKASRLLKHITSGEPVCITITHLDGLVMARSVFHHSMNYRSATIFGRGQLIEGDAEKLAALAVITEHVMPGRWADARQPTALELNATTVVEILIESAAAKIRSGPPSDDEEDYALPIWAGVLPLRPQWLATINDPRLSDGIELPSYLQSALGEKGVV
ncbi:MAG: pyridoxamine 5'-phosphate oxidase family protein [Chloroflexi bacterium]|nr:pyridoxamine 5'-phosphate oxidase family protein [Chloroflexota bacterium]